jgi:RNA 3'-terminal phosphate cyclase
MDASGFGIIMLESTHCCEVGSQTSGAAQLAAEHTGTHCSVDVLHTWPGGQADAAVDAQR